MSTVLFATLDAGGNVPPALPIGLELMRRGHSVRFMGHPAQAESIEADGVEFIPYRSAAPSTQPRRKGLRRTVPAHPHVRAGAAEGNRPAARLLEDVLRRAAA
ncbi:UDP:flavonoid glycosyltransferase YjiC (YdhE family) [Arthrobacter sp. CAN_A2]|uniref:hypothetical protein n=1 Tax=Arthrobacter sp. CAN_A2 TaxID=2787718 RepID=UPI0018EF71BE